MFLIKQAVNFWAMLVFSALHAEVSHPLLQTFQGKYLPLDKALLSIGMYDNVQVDEQYRVQLYGAGLLLPKPGSMIPFTKTKSRDVNGEWQVKRKLFCPEGIIRQHSSISVAPMPKDIFEEGRSHLSPEEGFSWLSVDEMGDLHYLSGIDMYFSRQVPKEFMGTTVSTTIYFDECEKMLRFRHLAQHPVHGALFSCTGYFELQTIDLSTIREPNEKEHVT